MKKMTQQTTAFAVLLGGLLSLDTAIAAGVPGIASEINEVLIEADNNQLLGDALSASVGTVGSEQLEHRPLLRPAEVLETVPGLIVTQHSGAGKANQYFLRGFNLDHATDFASYVDGMPVNMVTHGHGQGYSDLNFLIPELIQQMVYKKGPYYAEEGDFSSAGAGRISYAKKPDHGLIKFTTGEDNYGRLLVMDNFAVGDGNLLTAVEYQQTDGPWQLDEDFERKNLVLTYSNDNGARDYSVSLRIYEAEWVATDQIPQRLIDSGELSRFGFVTDTSGGDTHRYSFSGDYTQALGAGDLKISAYVVDYELSLTSDPTYFVNDPVNGDEFTQRDERMVWGGNLAYQLPLESIGSTLTSGLTLRYDDISDVGFGASQNRTIEQFSLRHEVEELGSGAYLSLQTRWTDWLETVAGVRYDYFSVDVDARVGVSGNTSDDLLSPKFSLKLGPWADTEFFINYGKSFHSNDARGTIVDVGSVPLLAESEGAEIGLRTAIVPDAQISFALFGLDLDSELVFVGDDGTTEPRGASRRTGWELGMYYQPLDWLIIDADVTESKAYFRDEVDGVRQRVPDAVERVMSLGVSADFPGGWHGGLRWRYLGSRALAEDNSVRSDSTSIINMNGGYHFSGGLSLGVEVINVLDAKDNDISYFFESLTASELAAGSDPIEDFHVHPVEPRTIRFTASYEF